MIHISVNRANNNKAFLNGDFFQIQLEEVAELVLETFLDKCSAHKIV